MKLPALFLSLLLITFISCSYHFYTKDEVIKRVKKGAYGKGENIVIEDSGNIVKVLVRDSNYQKLDEIYNFDENGKQLKYVVIASCDSCFKKYLAKKLDNKYYKWEKLTDSTYLSKQSPKSILTIHKSAYSYEILPL